ncbi:Rv3235 family protein [Arthrobacter sp. efr-133-TYG-104]|uniref:Rv3235 family protein n=1 Tax=Arthrobacter sp. efr-133-TYG-104 TaxID=3040324 RepID=UPI0025516322|nr:Rv3235 family protein [Arthrobacter sp. efr-133-TYG-104]
MTVTTATANRSRIKRTSAVSGSPGQNIDVRLVARTIAQAAMEVLAGTRPVQQLSRSLDPNTYLSLQHRAALTREHMKISRGRNPLHASPTVRSVRACNISELICEASIVVAEEQRTRAVAMRLERMDGTWRVTALEIG